MKLGKFKREMVIVPTALSDEIDDAEVLDEHLDDAGLVPGTSDDVPLRATRDAATVRQP